jgi:hypothetical protein
VRLIYLDVLSMLSRGASIFVLFVSTMHPFKIISSKITWTFSMLNIMSNSHWRAKSNGLLMVIVQNLAGLIDITYDVIKIRV